jgi:hypothetical protein
VHRCRRRSREHLGPTVDILRFPWAGGDEQRAAQQAVLHRAQLDAPVVLALIDGGRAVERDEGVVMVVPLLDPRQRHRGELSGAVGLPDAHEPGSLEQLTIRHMAGDGDRPIAVGTTTLAGTQPGGGVDGEERSASPWSEEASGCSQHGELGPQSTQHVGVDHGVERAGMER